jgi:hypothetical protein
MQATMVLVVGLALRPGCPGQGCCDPGLPAAQRSGADGRGRQENTHTPA